MSLSQIVARELRLVRVHPVQVAAPGRTATFVLLKRPRDSIIAEAVQQQEGEGEAESVGKSGDGGGGGAAHRGTQQQQPGGGGAASRPGWADSAASAPAATAAVAASSSSSGAEPTAGLPRTRFAKFRLASAGDAAALWVAEAQQLAQQAAQVTAEGGLEAAYAAPNIYGAIDLLAARARAAAERRQRQLLEPSAAAAAGGPSDALLSDASSSLLLTPEEAGLQAAQAVKGSTTAALSAAAAAREHQAAEAARERLFPSLAPARPSAAAAVAAQAAAPSDGQEEGEAGGASTSTSAVPAIAGPPVARTAALPIRSPGAHGGAAAEHEQLQPPLSSSARSAGSAGGHAPLGSSPSTAAGSPADPSTTSSRYYFYQASDGQWLFLSPLNLKMLLAHHGSYAACPPLLTARVLEVEGVAQDEASRRRQRTLAHLPLAATFALAEVDLSGEAVLAVVVLAGQLDFQSFGSVLAFLIQSLNLSRYHLTMRVCRPAAPRGAGAVCGGAGAAREEACRPRQGRGAAAARGAGWG